MYIDAETIGKAAALLGALGIIGGLCYKIVTWVQRQTSSPLISRTCMRGRTERATRSRANSAC